MSRLTVEQIESCRTIGRDEKARSMSIGLSEIDALCDTALLGALGRRERLPDERSGKTHHFVLMYAVTPLEDGEGSTEIAE